jgi:linoleoyl-CoA desaturase
MNTQSKHHTSRELNADELEAFGRELDAIRADVIADLGERDVEHIRNMIRVAQYSELAGRGLLHFGIGPLSFLAGTGALATSKILENMEIGHNIMHGQYDWTGDPELDGNSYEWDIACTGDNWRHYHNYEHHTFTNILGKDRDIGYGAIRVSAEQPWHPGYLVQPVGALVLASLFQWGVAMHDLRVEEVADGTATPRELLERSKPFLKKAGWQLAKDYAFFPLIAGLNAPRVFMGNLGANFTRNIWTFAVIFCGHFPEGVRVYQEEEVEDETRGGWYLRQLQGSANFEGSRFMHILTGHLSHQIEHHMFPDIPAHRYPEIAPRVQSICERYGQRYHSGSFASQLASTAKMVLRHALPSSPERRRKADPVAYTPEYAAA